MKEIDLSVPPPEPADAIADRISAAAELTGYKHPSPTSEHSGSTASTRRTGYPGSSRRSRAAASSCSSRSNPTASPHAATAPARWSDSSRRTYSTKSGPRSRGVFASSHPRTTHSD